MGDPGIFTPLQKALKTAYLTNTENIITVNQHVLRELENNVFILGDLDISIEEIPLIIRFMASKEALSSVKTLVVSRKYVNGATQAGRKATVIQTNKQSSLLMNKCKLQFAAIDFISRCASLETVIFDTVTIKTELFTKLGQALAAPRKGPTAGAGLRYIAFRSVPVGTNGLRALCPHLGKLTCLQRLELDKCSLDDASGTFLSSILKAQEAHFDQQYWNATLRLDPEEVELGLAEELLEVCAQGLVMLSVEGNAVGDVGLAPLVRTLRHNRWLLGINLSNNKLSYDGVESLACALAENRALHAVCLGGNPGLTLSTVQTMAASVAAAPTHNTLALPEDMAHTLRRWCKLQASEAYSFDHSQQQQQHYLGSGSRPGGDRRGLGGLPAGMGLSGAVGGSDGDSDCAEDNGHGSGGGGIVGSQEVEEEGEVSSLLLRAEDEGSSPTRAMARPQSAKGRVRPRSAQTASVSSSLSLSLGQGLGLGQREREGRALGRSLDNVIASESDEHEHAPRSGSGSNSPPGSGSGSSSSPLGLGLLRDNDALEYAIPTPVGPEGSSDFQGSPEISVRSSSGGGFYHQRRGLGSGGLGLGEGEDDERRGQGAVRGNDGRPPSRNSLRPRSVSDQGPAPSAASSAATSLGSGRPQATQPPSGTGADWSGGAIKCNTGPAARSWGPRGSIDAEADGMLAPRVTSSSSSSSSKRKSKGGQVGGVTATRDVRAASAGVGGMAAATTVGFRRPWMAGAGAGSASTSGSASSSRPRSAPPAGISAGKAASTARSVGRAVTGARAMASEAARPAAKPASSSSSARRDSQGRVGHGVGRGKKTQSQSVSRAEARLERLSGALERSMEAIRDLSVSMSESIGQLTLSRRAGGQGRGGEATAVVRDEDDDDDDDDDEDEAAEDRGGGVGSPGASRYAGSRASPSSHQSLSSSPGSRLGAGAGLGASPSRYAGGGIGSPLASNGNGNGNGKGSPSSRVSSSSNGSALLSHSQNLSLSQADLEAMVRDKMRRKLEEFVRSSR